jgi:peptidoglycan/LPS O-acetylase OafA/YrhL
MPVKKNYLPLDGLRALAAIAVVCFHYCPRGAGWWNGLLASGPSAVGFFFLLSGFVLAIRHPEVRDRSQFWRARLIRIYPMYLLAFLFFAPLAIQKYHHDLKTLALSFVLNVTMLQAWTALAQSWNGPSWSLSVEAFLYAIFPFLVGLVARRKGLARWGLLALLPGVFTIAFCRQWVPAHIWRAWVENNPLFGVPAFSFGVALGLSGLRLQLRERTTDLAIALSMIAIVGIALVWPSSYREVLIAGGLILPLGCLVVLCTQPSKTMQAALGNSVMVRFGKASYITYIMQAPLWHYFQVASNLIARRPLTENSNGVVHFLVFLAILLTSSLLLDRFVDEPIRELLSRKPRQAVVETVGVAA